MPDTLDLCVLEREVRQKLGSKSTENQRPF
jgi:hypothetical protein